MSAPQGTAYWGGIHDFISANFTFAPGISPSVCRIVIPPQSMSRLQAGGDLTWSYGGRRVIFRNCRLDSVSASGGAGRPERWTLYIKDRRWLWRETGKISGFYNARTAGGLKKETEKSPRELATLCLQAMGEKKFSLAGLPNDTRPEIDWDYTNPAEALARLCDALGCSVVLALDDRVSIVRNGQGRSLPRQGIIDGGEVLDPPDPPGKIAIVGGRTRYQHDFELEAVGLDIDGEIKPVLDVSYIKEFDQKQGLENIDLPHLNGLTDPKFRGLARQSLYRWYRIKTPFHLPGVKRPIKDLRRILPLEDTQIEIAKTGKRDARKKTGAGYPLPPWIYGVFYQGGESYENSADKPEPDIKKHPEGFYQGGLEIDAESGIVRFSQLAYRFKEVHGKRLIFPADLRLRIAVNLRDASTRGWVRQEYSRGAKVRSRNPSRNKYVLREDVVREIYQRVAPKPAKTVDNIKGVTKMAKFYFQSEVAKYTPRQAGTVTYSGIVPVSPDGVAKQVTFVVDDKGRATTRVSLNREEPHIAPTYAEKRFHERLFEQLKEAGKPNTRRKDDARKRNAS